MTPHTDAATTLAGIRSIRERRRKYHYYADKLPSVEPGTQVYRDYQFILADYEGATGEELDILLDTVAALQRQLDDAQARERAAGYSVLVTIAPEWQGNYSHEWDEVLVVVGSEWRDGQQWYEVSGRNGKGWMPPEQLRLATGGQP